MRLACGFIILFLFVASDFQVQQAVHRAREASKIWKNSSFEERRHLLSIMLKYTIEHQDEICRLSAIDSGKPLVDAAFGELIVTCEKLKWLMGYGEKYLRPEKRYPGIMQFYKSVRVEYCPLGVVGAIVPFNYPFHNIFNPLSAAVFAGNAIVIKVSEHASYSALHYKAAIDAALRAAGAPPDLVQIITGYGDAGAALVESGVDKLIFVGSTEVGRRVMAAASKTLTPVVLELGGKDAFVVCEDADLSAVVPTALRGCFQAGGQNCLGAERFIVHSSVEDRFVDACARVVRQMRVGDVSDAAAGRVDCGSLCLPGLAEKVQSLVDDAVGKGAKVVCGGTIPKELSEKGQFYPPTILSGITSDMRIWKEEVFGPVMTIATFDNDAEAIAMANDCPFGLGCSVWSRRRRRADSIAARIESGMVCTNDFAATYMAQCLPFGGVKESGFDRFAGIEGLRGMCIPRSVAEDRWPFISTTIPPLLQYPVHPNAFPFLKSLIWMFYAPGMLQKAKGLYGVLRSLTTVARPEGEQSSKAEEEKSHAVNLKKKEK